jgi:hypothetical protein
LYGAISSEGIEMAEIHDLAQLRAAKMPKEARQTPNQEILARIQARAQAADTPEARLLTEMRAMEETLFANHRRYVRMWEAADQLGILPPVRTAKQIVADADPMFPVGTPPLPEWCVERAVNTEKDECIDWPVIEARSPESAPEQIQERGLQPQSALELKQFDYQRLLDAAGDRGASQSKGNEGPER